MLFRSFAIVAVLGAGVGVAAQTPVDPQVSADTILKVRNFEGALRKAIEQAGSQLGERARESVKDAVLRFERPPSAQGIIYPTGEGMIFVVEPPAIEMTSVLLYDRMVQLSMQQQNIIPSPNAPRVATAPTVTVSAPMTNPVVEYSEFTRQALVDTMLDFAFPLPLKPGQTLSLSVGDGGSDQGNPLAPVTKRLYLTIKADDLIALRANTITRDEAKSRIVEKRY